MCNENELPYKSHPLLPRTKTHTSAKVHHSHFRQILKRSSPNGSAQKLTVPAVDDCGHNENTNRRENIQLGIEGNVQDSH